ncbi:MAG: LPS export ABC transporter permease LptF [Gammaproteobacteria bacterium]|nr:MAG: LPS export ABC transporter permease LptF [Gammaproteobacteria bacterium]
MIIHRAFYREATQATLAITGVIMVVLVFFGMTALLGRVAGGRFTDTILFTLLGLQTLKRLDLLLPLALYLGILLTLSRWYRDSEMTVLAACGVGLLELLRPVMVLALIVSLAVGVLSFYFTPLAYSQMERVKNENAARPDIGRMAPGAFIESSKGQRIFYTEKIDSRNGVLKNVFVGSFRDGKRGVLVARSGKPYVEPKTGDKFLALKNGALYEGIPGEADYRILEFETYNVRLEPKKVEPSSATTSGMSSDRLFGSRVKDHVAEWHWRMAKPIVVLVLSVFALVLAYTDVRRGRLSNVFTAILVYFIYSNLLVFGQTLIKKGQIPSVIGLWWVHILLAFIAGYLLMRRARNLPLLPLPRAAKP